MKHFLLFFLLLISTLGYSKFVPETPGTHCTDRVGVLQKATIDSLNIKLQQLQQETGAHFLVYVDDSLYGENLEEYVNKLFNSWELGDKDKNNGILFAVFVKDRAFRIAVGYGLEGLLPDLKINNFQNEILIPNLKEGNFDAGISGLALAIIDQLNGAEAKAYKIARRLQISDTENILKDAEKDDLFNLDHEERFGLDYETIYKFYHIQLNGSPEILNAQIENQWLEIQNTYPDKKLKMLFAYSVKDHCYAIKMDKELLSYLNLPISGNAFNLKDDGYLKEHIKDSSYRYVFAGISFLMNKNMERNQFISYHPIIYYLGIPFYSEYDLLYSPPLMSSLLILLIYSTLISTLTNLFILLFLYKEDKESKFAFIGWTLLNVIVPIIGMLLQIRILYKLIKILKKQGDYLKYIAAAKKLGVMGHLKEFNKNSGGSYSGSTYSSSGSYSSRSSSYSSSSSSSSSYSGYSGGGGGRTGGGGSSGRW